MSLDLGKASLALSDGHRCQYHDPDFVNSNSYGNTWCYLGFVNGLQNAYDWHLHTTGEPDGGRAYLGNNSLHWGVHAGAASADTLQPWPARDRVYQVDAVGIEPRWRSATELAFQLPGASAIHQVTVTPASGSPVGARRPLVEDRRFVDTPGWSFAFTGTGGLIYLRSPASDEGHYLRVVPNWVDQMKRAVDEANR
jgi:hypothetical protein